MNAVAEALLQSSVVTVSDAGAESTRSLVPDGVAYTVRTQRSSSVRVVSFSSASLVTRPKSSTDLTSVFVLMVSCEPMGSSVPGVPRQAVVVFWDRKPRLRHSSSQANPWLACDVRKSYGYIMSMHCSLPIGLGVKPLVSSRACQS